MTTTPVWALKARQRRVFDNMTEYQRTVDSKFVSKSTKVAAKAKIAELMAVIHELDVRIDAAEA